MVQIVDTVVFLTFESLIGFLVIVTNGIVILTYIRTPSLHSVRNYFILSVASADLLAGAAIPPTSILTYMGLPKEFYGCVMVHSLIITLTGISIFNLMALTIDRYISIQCATSYDTVLCPRNAIIFILVIWVVATFIGFIPLYLWQLPQPDIFLDCEFSKVIPRKYIVYVFIFVVQGIPFVSLIVLLIVIYRKLHQEMALATEMLPFDDQEENRRSRRELTSISLIVVALLVCWLPIDILDMIALFAPDLNVPVRFIWFCVVFSHARAFTTPYFFAYGDIDLRKAIVRTVPLTKHIVPPINEPENKYSLAGKYIADNPVEIVSVVLSPPKLQAREQIKLDLADLFPEEDNKKEVSDSTNKKEVSDSTDYMEYTRTLSGSTWSSIPNPDASIESVV